MTDLTKVEEIIDFTGEITLLLKYLEARGITEEEAVCVMEAAIASLTES